MHWNSIKLSTKLPATFVCLLILIAATALIGFHQLGKALNTFNVEVAAVNQQEREIRLVSLAFKGQIQEWKNVLLRGKDSTQLEKYWSSFEKEEQAVSSTAQHLIDTIGDPSSRELVRKFSEAHQAMGKKYRDGLSAFKDGAFEPEIGDKAVKGIDREPSKLLDEASENIVDSAAKLSASTAAAANRAKNLSLIAIFVVLLVGCGIGIIVSRSVTIPLQEAAHSAKLVSEGNLTGVIEIKGKDEIGELMRALYVMNENLIKRIGDIRNGVNIISTASEQIALGNQDLSLRTEHQATSLEETASSMEELTSTVKQNADNAHHANKLAITAADVAQKGGAVVSQVIQTMDSINSASQKIVDIISVIDGIAFQTNILALNAAVEAARAGEQGRGFAVVASEVRNLAHRSASAAKEIKLLIGDSVERVGDGAKLVQRAGDTMHEIVESIGRVTEIMSEISTASREQTTGIEQINIAITSIDDITQQNSALVEEAAAASGVLRDQASTLAQAVSTFKLPPTHADANARTYLQSQRSLQLT